MTSTLRTLAMSAERWFDRTRFSIKKAAGLLSTPMILTYRGFAVEDGIWLRGRIIEDQGVRSAGPTASTWNNIWLTLKRYETDEIAGARLSYRFEDAGGTLRQGIVTTGDDGYFDARIACVAGEAMAPWTAVELELIEAPGYTVDPLGAHCEVRVVSRAARYGVISDIDDTIIHTGATSLFKHWRTVVANSAETRTAFPGVSHLYRGLAEGRAGEETNPFFYVSSSPWNLFDLFERFMILHKIPLGPVLLKDFGLDADKWFTGSHDAHKLSMIDRILAACPDLSFLLIGDSGQRDVPIYAEVARRYPGRVLAVHIRDVTDGIFAPRIMDGLESLKKSGIEVTVSPTMQAAADHAVEHGLVDPRVADEVAAAIDERAAGRKTPFLRGAT